MESYILLGQTAIFGLLCFIVHADVESCWSCYYLIMPRLIGKLKLMMMSRSVYLLLFGRYTIVKAIFS